MEGSMPDNPKKKGTADRGKVAGGQKHEVDYLLEKVPGATRAQAKSAIKAFGPSRAKVTAELRKKVGTLLD
jgi:hypothetical protein